MVGYVDPFLAMVFSNQRARRSCSKLLYVYPLICWMYLARLSRLMSLRVPRQSTQNRIEFDYDGINMDAVFSKRARDVRDEREMRDEQRSSGF
jgi:hypothetical protein